MNDLVIFPVSRGPDGVLEVQDDAVFSTRDLTVVSSVEGLAVRTADVRWRDQVRPTPVYRTTSGAEFVRADELAPAEDDD